MATNNNPLLNCPPLRFPEFSDPWQQTTLGEIGAYLRGVTYSSSDISQYGIPIMRATNINSGTTLNYTSDVVRANARIAKNQILQKGDIVICAANGSSDLVGKNSYYDGSSKEPITVGAFCGIYRSECILSRWIFQTDLYRKYIQTAIQGGNGSIANLKPTVVLEQVYALPSLAEQRKIAEFLSLIDERIETQRQTIEERKKQKKALLHQIFSQSLRFPDFSDPWQQTTLGEVAERVIRKNHNNESNRPLTISAQYGLIDQRDFFKKVIASNNLEGYYLLHQGEFAYNRSSSADYPWGAIKRLEKYSQGVLSTLYICFRITKGNPLFFTYLFDAFKWHSYVQSISAEGARNHGLLNIAVSDFFDMPISLPSLEEQRKIAELLTIFDERIEAEEALLKCYEAQKRYLLRQMFV